MGIINVLPEHLSNQIAAGEVVDRPVSVVKELLENSLDAGASKISISFRNGGKTLVCVEDNGCGMNEEDAERCFQRYATSKLTAIDDLQQIRSYGFRGEALPSIASVSNILLRTRPIHRDLGIEIEMSGGKIMDKRLCGCPVGTTFRVDQLFFNVPVRRKFLKSDATESSNIVHTTRLYAIGHPEVHFELESDANVIFRSPPCPSLFARVNELWSRSTRREWVAFRETINDVVVEGVLSPPGLSDVLSTDVHILVNRRPVANTLLTNAVKEAYRGLLPPNTFPSIFLLVDVDPKDVDVNVHPTKREVRFKNEMAVRNAAIQTLRSVLRRLSQPSFLGHPPTSPTEIPSASAQPTLRGDLLKSPSEATEISPLRDNGADRWRFLSHWQGDYVLLGMPDTLMILNARHAFRRVVYEEAKTKIEESRLLGQGLLVPHSFEVNSEQSEQLSRNIPFLDERCGIVLRPFGKNVFLLEAVPIWIHPGEEASVIRYLLETIGTGEDLQFGRWGHESVARLIATNAHFDPTSLNETVVDKLLYNLFECQNPTTSPEGYRLWWEISLSEVSKRLR
jgi:DNA mismatch repair protein MutL